MSHFPKLSKNEKEIETLILKEVVLCDNMSSDKTLDDYIMIVKNKRQKIIKEHEASHSIWQNSTNKKWYTKLGKDKHLIVRKERGDLQNVHL